MMEVIVVVSCILEKQPHTASRREEPETGAQWQAYIISLHLLI